MRRVILLYLCFSLAFVGAVFSQDIKEADLAGSWYPDNSGILYVQISDYLKNVKLDKIGEDVIALICPHAGIIYSGETAAYAFSAVKDKKIDTLVLVGFSHRLGYDGIAVFDAGGFKTPLGVLNTDKGLMNDILSMDEKIFVNPNAFNQENSIELILPFIQASLAAPKVLLLAIGKQTKENSQILGNALYEILKKKENFLIIASTDMSHYLDEEAAEMLDASTASLIAKMQPDELFLKSKGKNRMCGLAAVTSVMIAAKKLGANSVRILKRATSAAASKDTSRVVGYLSAALVRKDKEAQKTKKEKKDMGKILNDEQKKELLKLARDTLTLSVSSRKVLEANVDDEQLKQVMGVFVTLNKNGRLRGCIGNIIGTKPLYIGVRDMAIASSSQDPRFGPVEVDELNQIDIEISVLSPLEKITDPDEIILGTHGVLVKDGLRSGVYLPQVATETGWSKDEFMNSLCSSKAGMAPDAWKTGKCEIYIFSAEVFGEK